MDTIDDEHKAKQNPKQSTSSRKDKYKLYEEVEGTAKFKYPFRELFFWAVINNMMEMAMFFWKFEEEGMKKAIIGAHISKLLVQNGSQSKMPDEIIRTLAENSRQFSELSVQILDECYKADKLNTEKLLTTSASKQFKNMTCLNLAVASGHLEFVSHSSVQSLLNQVWTGPILNQDISFLKIATAFICPFLIPRFFDFKNKKELEQMARAGDIGDDKEDMKKQRKEDSENDCDKYELFATNGEKKKQPCHAQQETNILHQLHATVTSKQRKNGIEEEEEENEELSILQKLRWFYFRTPVVIFCTNVSGYFGFLCLYSYITMLEKKTLYVSVWEYLLIVTMIGYFVSEIYQIVQTDAPTFRLKIIRWWSSSMNRFDAIAISMFFVAVGLRLRIQTLEIGNLLYAINCFMWILRLLNVFYIHPVYGPYVVMIIKMFKDMKHFVVIWFVFLLAYGVSKTAILSPQPGSFMMLVGILFHPYFNMYGELFIDQPDIANITSFGTEIHNEYAEPIAWVLLAAYLLIANVLLLNLLIAIFNNTYEEVRQNAAQIWKNKRYGLMIEYSERQSAVPPFSLIPHVIIFIQWLMSLCCRCVAKPVNISGLKTRCTKKEQEELVDFENICMAQIFWKKKSGIEKTTNDVYWEIEDLKNDIATLKILQT